MGPPRSQCETFHFDGRVLCVYDGKGDAQKQDELFVACWAELNELKQPEAQGVVKAEFLTTEAYERLRNKEVWKTVEKDLHDG